ncbi:hypothetical protein TWF694_007365 [Orbilia ellipsospora]|uniref:MACPF-like domain-containing protein n=1 Tax=Orbilia ellipsospora TaxID=2528407 RepID=A0AAV9XIE6_9PEZI
MISSSKTGDKAATTAVPAVSPDTFESKGGARPRAAAISKRPEQPQSTEPGPSVPEAAATKPRTARSSTVDVRKNQPEKQDGQNVGNNDKNKNEHPSGKPPNSASSNGNKFMKIIEITEDSPGKISESKQTKATVHGARLLNFEGVKLANLRNAAGAQLKESHKFCYLDGSIAPDSMLLKEYLETLFEEEHPNGVSSTETGQASEGDADQDSAKTDAEKKNDKIKELKKPKLGNIAYVLRPQGLTPEARLLSPQFLMKIFEWKVTPGAESEKGNAEGRGSIHSKSFGDADIAQMTLAGLRKRVTGMSAHTRVHRFCTPTGTTVEDESLTLTDYLNQETEEETSPAKESKATPVIKVYYKLNQSMNQPHVNLEPPAAIKANTTLTGYAPTKKELNAYASKSLQFEADVTSIMNKSNSGNAKGAAYLTEADWEQVFRNCSLLFGWYVDRDKNCIRQAPKQAFQLKSKNMKDSTLHDIPDFVDPPVASKKQKGVHTATTNSTYIEEPVATSKHTDKHKVPELHSLNGTNAFKAAMKPSSLDVATRLSNIVTKPSTSSDIVTTGGTKVEAGDTGVTEETTIKVGEEKTTSKPATEEEESSADGDADGKSKLPKTSKREMVMPSFQVNDDSRIEVIISEHEFETSMAKNDFSSKSTEASMTGGYAGFSASVSAGHSQAKSKSTKTTETNYKKTIISKYLFPRATVHLHPDDLEPTPELANLIELIYKQNNINHLRKLHQDFGHLFCKKVTLGGRLLSSKVMEGKEKGTEQEQKEQFKTSMELQIQTPVGVGAGVKHERESGSGTANRENEKDKNEKHVFEAVGGDTILAATPGEWSSSVAHEKYWRVIERDGLYPLADFISAIPGLQNVSGYFMRAVPALTKYIEMPPSKEIKARFKLVTPTSNLALGNDALYYLGHEFGRTSTMPGLNSLKRQTVGWLQIDYKIKIPLFSPSTTRAPVLQGYKNNLVGDKMFGTTYTKEFAATTWSVIAPFDDALQNGTRVILRTVPFTGGATTTVNSRPGENAVSLVVYRNQQGHFLPALSDIDEFQYWRIWKKDSSRNPKEYIKEGDSIRFSWSFGDQTTGFRDYYDDVFGRRRNQCPPDLSNTVLWLKLPFPRFETLEDGYNFPFNSLIMAPISDTKTTEIDLRCLPAIEKGAKSGCYKYQMEDVTFRIDTVANDGKGDTDDYMMKDVQQTTIAGAFTRAFGQDWQTTATLAKSTAFYL